MLPIGAILGIAQGVMGGAKALFPDQFNKKRPKYEIPAENRNALALSAMLAKDPEMPGQSAMRDDIALTSANALEAARQSGGLGENVAGIQAQQNKANRDLGIAAAQDQKEDIGNYQNQLMAMGEKKDQQFQMNEFAPYADQTQEGKQMIGAGISNVSNALQENSILDLLKSPSNLGSTAINSPTAGVGLSSDTRNLGGGIGLNSDTRNLGGGIGNSVISNLLKLLKY